MGINERKLFTDGTSIKSIKLFFLIAVIVLLLFAIFSFMRIKTLIESSSMVNHSNVVKLKLEEVTSALSKAESHQRGFMLTGDPSFLKPYNEAKAIINSKLDQLYELTKDNAVQERNMVALKRMCNQRLDYMQSILNEGRDKLITNERWLEGKSIMDAIRLRVSGMNVEEDRLLQLRSNILSKDEWNTPAVTIILILCALLIIILSYFRILRELKKSQDLIEKQKRSQDEILLSNESLKKSEERYHLMAGEVQDYAILLLSKDGIIENWNKGAEKIKGYAADEIVGKHFSIFYSERDRKEKLPDQLINEAITKGKALHEGWRIRKDGTTFWGSIVITCLKDKDGNIIGFSKVTRDLSERKIAEETIQKHAEELEKKNINLQNLNNELQSFAYVASHDLQEPLRKIQIFASRIIENDTAALTPYTQENFKRIQDSAKRMQILIDDLLDYAQMNRSEPQFEMIDLSEVVAEVVKELKESIKEKHASIRVETSCEVNIIHFQFRQLLQNLINNAIKFSRNGIPPEIIIRSNIENGDYQEELQLSSEIKYCHISITDNGIGFDPVYSKRIFEIFQRLHGKAEYKGTGIGLAICKKIVENHEGAITAEGEEGKGSVFHIYIPHYPNGKKINKSKQ